MTALDTVVSYTEYDGFDRGNLPPHDGHAWVKKEAFASQSLYLECMECGAIACAHKWKNVTDRFGFDQGYQECPRCLTKRESPNVFVPRDP